ncbi:MAG: hypothetical protein BVN33_14730 [Proteobacteria bacterium ST_bin13]|nr:MAG: hypothetical protein BVN33_14730 [Proteobacteria bacterium ST_bin13]
MKIANLEVGNARVRLAKDVSGKAIGVTVELLVLTDDVHDLPEPLKASAHAVLYKAAVEE